MNFEILPAERAQRLPEGLRQIEGVRLFTEEHRVGEGVYRKVSVVAPLPDGDRRERVVLFIEEGGRLRMLGFHNILRHLDAPEGGTTVFHSALPNPLSGNLVEVPTDTYDWLALAAAAASVSARKPLVAHLWHGRAAAPIEITNEGTETLSVLGSKALTRRLRVRLARAVDVSEAVYWFNDASPHALLQYRGPANLLLEDDGEGPVVVLRATASSEQVRSVLEH